MSMKKRECKMEYIEFLKSKIDIAPKTGIEISEEVTTGLINIMLK